MGKCGDGANLFRGGERVKHDMQGGLFLIHLSKREEGRDNDRNTLTDFFGLNSHERGQI